MVGSEQNERHNHPDPGPKQLNRLSRALYRRSAADGRLRRRGHPDQQVSERDDPADQGADLGADPYRLVIIDCPPSLGQLTRCALTAADRAMLVTDPTMFSVSGVQRAFDAIQTERQRGNPDLQPLGVLINRVRPRNSEHEFRIAELRELYGPLVLTGVLPDRSAVQQAQGACLPIQRWDTPGAREASAVFTLLLGRVLRSDRSRRDIELPDSLEATAPST
jgi:chromosome partitioning protein